MTWTTVLADRATGQSIGELRDVTARRWKRVLNRPVTVSWTARADNALAAQMLELDLVLAKFYEDSTGDDVLRFIGPQVSFEKARDSSGGTIAVVGQDAFWRLGHRLIGQSAAGSSFGTVLAPIDKGSIAAQVLAEANANFDTGIRLGTVLASSTGYGTYTYKEADQIIAELSATLGGFDWNLVPVEPAADALGLQIGRLDIGPAIGTVLPDIVWEFGTGKANVASFRDVGDATALCNRAFNLPSGFPDTTTAPSTVLVSQDNASIVERGLHEALVSADLLVDVLRRALIDEHVAVRKRPRRVITFQPIAEEPTGTTDGTRRVPRLFADYDVGDIVRFRAVERVTIAAEAIVGFPATPIVEDANRANQPLNTGAWAELDYAVNPLAIDTSRIGGSNFAGSYLTAPVADPTQEIYASVPVIGGGGVSLFLRIGEPAHTGLMFAYLVYWDGFGAVELYRMDPGNSFVLLQSFPIVLAAGDRIGARIVGDQLSSWHKPLDKGWRKLATVTDDTYSSGGYLAWYLESSTTRLDDLGGGSFTDPSREIVTQSTTTVDALFRVFGADVAIDDNGQSTPSLVLVEE